MSRAPLAKVARTASVYLPALRATLMMMAPGDRHLRTARKTHRDIAVRTEQYPFQAGVDQTERLAVRVGQVPDVRIRLTCSDLDRGAWWDLPWRSSH
jgi:hypothetical protein